MNYETIAQPLQLGNCTLKNRIIFAPTSFGEGAQARLARLRRIAQGGCAMIILGDVPVQRRGMGTSLFSDKGQAYYRAVTEALHEENCLACAQLHQSDANFKAMLKYLPGVLCKKISADELRVRLNDEVSPYITGLSAKKIRTITSAFGSAASQAKALGFDMVQVHGDRMCGSFASTVFNHRRDAYGGSLENRLRFAVEAVQAVRAAEPDMAIDFKLVIRQQNPDYGCAGLLPEELAVAVPLLERAGVTSFHVTLANHTALSNTIPPASHPVFGEEGCFLSFCDMVRPYTTVPICGVGGLTDPGFVEVQLAGGRIDAACMSRQLIADADWPRKVLSGEADTIRCCVRCNKKCLGGIMAHQGVHCIFEEGGQQ